MATVRPRHAATLVILRQMDGGLHVLMGHRAAGHVFMPNALVYPGGAVDTADHRLACPGCLPPRDTEMLARQPRGADPRALALAAIRETFEETGLRIARPAPAPLHSRNRDWAAFLRSPAGPVEPALDRLAYVARAITPPVRTRRFDARFFATTADAILGDPDDFSGASGELGTLSWIPVQTVLESDVRPVTKRGLRRAVTWHETPAEARDTLPVPYVRAIRGERIEVEL